MKKRNPLLVALWTIITLGIYSLFWLSSTRDEMVKKKANIPPFWFVLLPFLLLVVLLLQVVVRLNTSANSGAVTATNITSIVMGVAALVGIPLGIYFFWKYCGGVAKVTKGKMGQGASFGLLILLSILSSGLTSRGGTGYQTLGVIAGLAWIPIIQYSFNRYAK